VYTHQIFTNKLTLLKARHQQKTYFTYSDEKGATVKATVKLETVDQHQKCVLLYCRVHVLGTSLLSLTAACGMQWVASSTSLLTCRTSCQRSALVVLGVAHQLLQVVSFILLFITVSFGEIMQWMTAINIPTGGLWS